MHTEPASNTSAVILLLAHEFKNFHSLNLYKPTDLQYCMAIDCGNWHWSTWWLVMQLIALCWLSTEGKTVKQTHRWSICLQPLLDCVTGSSSGEIPSTRQAASCRRRVNCCGTGAAFNIHQQTSFSVGLEVGWSIEREGIPDRAIEGSEMWETSDFLWHLRQITFKTKHCCWVPVQWASLAFSLSHIA